MQYIRLYTNAQGQVEHIETSKTPLPPDAALEAHELTKPRLFDHISLEFTPTNSRFHRAQELMKSITIRKFDLNPRLKSASKVKGEFANIIVTRVSRA